MVAPTIRSLVNTDHRLLIALPRLWRMLVASFKYSSILGRFAIETDRILERHDVGVIVGHGPFHGGHKTLVSCVQSAQALV